MKKGKTPLSPSKIESSDRSCSLCESSTILKERNHILPSSHRVSSSGHRNKVLTRLSKLFGHKKRSDSSPSVNIPSKAMSENHVLEQPVPLVRTKAYTPPDAISGPEVPTINSVGSIDVTELPEYYVWVWGSNTCGQVMIPRSKLADPNLLAISTPQRIDRLAHRCITQLNCGPESTWLVSDSGDVWAGGQNNKVSKPDVLR